MNAFAELFAELESQKNKGKIAALVRFFEQAEPEDAAWALHLLNEGKSPTRISGARMREAVSVSTGLPLWLIEESYAMVGDLAETCALLLRSQGQSEQPLHHWIAVLAELKRCRRMNKPTRSLSCGARFRNRNYLSLIN